MKRILILISIISSLSILTSKSIAQGNLQFNQVLTYTGSLSQYNSSPQFIVPNGKVWKVETYTYDFMYLNSGVGSPNLINSNKGPMWLKSGDMIYYYAYCYNCSTTYLLSIVEFNIVP